ncbi:MAG: PTS transporter subunit EIIB [Candidatus Eisenbacteria bacterium]
MEEYMRQAGPEGEVPRVAAVLAPPTADARAAAGAGAGEVVARAAAVGAALGGAGNIVQIESCALTRLRVELRDGQSVNQDDLVAAGAMGMMRVSENLIHVIVGNDAPHLAALLQR